MTDFAMPAGGAAFWTGVALALFLCFATAISYSRLAKFYPETASADCSALPASFSARPAPGIVWICNAIAGWASDIGFWALPGVWLTLTSTTAAYMISQIWPRVPSGSPLAVALAAAVLSFGLSYVRSRRAVLGLNLAVVAIQVPALLSFALLFAAQRHHALKSEPVWLLDSSGTPTQYVQDMVPDSSMTLIDPAGPTGPAQAPGATLPKVDQGGNPIWVYDAVDAKGNLLVNTAGNPIHVPTDASGKLAALPPGAADAIPEKAAGLPSHQGPSSSFNWRPLKLTAPPLGLDFHAGEDVAALLALATFQFIASLGRGTKWRSVLIAAIVVPVFLALGASGYLLEHLTASYFLHSTCTVSSAASSSAPIGDMMQLIGSWAFGNPKAGWWFMLSEYSAIFLALVAATLLSFETGAGVARALGHHDWAPRPNTSSCPPVPHSLVLIRAAVAYAICSLGAVISAFRFSVNDALSGSPPGRFSAGPPGTLSYRIATTIPDFSTAVLYVGGWAAIALCIVICFASLMHSGRGRFLPAALSATGMLAGLAILAAYLSGPFFVEDARSAESIGALILCAVAGIATMPRSIRRARKSESPRGFEPL